jgi:glutamine amidotransferase
VIAIIDYKAGNIASVSNALKRLGANYVVTNQHQELDNADKIIFPGVGHARSAMNSLEENGLDSWLKNTQKPVLGICLGMQLLFESTEEGDTKTLGIIAGRLKKFDSTHEKVPHMGWNVFLDFKNHIVLNGTQKNDYVYYVHSYYAPVTPETIATSSYAGVEFASVVAVNNFMGMQFHPEKSGDAGLKLLNNFLLI